MYAKHPRYANLISLFFYQVDYFVILKVLYLRDLPTYSKRVYQLHFRSNFVEIALRSYLQ